MRASRACVLLLIGSGIAACAAPRTPEPAAARVETPAASPHATPATRAAAVAEPQAELKGSPHAPATPAVDPKPSGDVLTGAWGGLHVLLTLSATGGRIEYDCAQGALDEPVRPDAHGVFHVRGQHVQNQGGPQRAADEPTVPQSQQATYDGTVSGDRMQLRVTSNGEAIGSYALRRGADPHMAYCL